MGLLTEPALRRCLETYGHLQGFLSREFMLQLWDLKLKSLLVQNLRKSLGNPRLIASPKASLP